MLLTRLTYHATTSPCICVQILAHLFRTFGRQLTGMTNYRNGPTTDHSAVVFDYNGLVLHRVAHFGTSYGISEP